ncbi:50S ribosomal protein L4 [Candidatus Daviesbacteria bacterium]|nr:50S ribosomal protein L4 [Candidatus Daviesbacteria bacterium]
MPVKQSLRPKGLKKSLIVNRKSSIVKTNKVERKTTNEKRQTKLSVPAYSLAGRAAGNLTLPKDIFGVKVNKKLLAQAMRVYMTNKKVMTASTKTRGEVVGSTAKIYAQKGTGRARHGSITAPIFVGGGVVFGPKIRKVTLNLPQKMRKAALVSALSDKAANKIVWGVSGLEKATGKTKQLASLLKKIGTKNALIVTAEKKDNVIRAVSNIPSVDVLSANLINTFEVLRHDGLILTKEAVDTLSGKGKAERVK